jgi:hypothetical protein
MRTIEIPAGVNVGVTSDTHAGHANILQYCLRPWLPPEDRMRVAAGEKVKVPRRRSISSRSRRRSPIARSVCASAASHPSRSLSISSASAPYRFDSASRAAPSDVPVRSAASRSAIACQSRGASNGLTSR